MPAVKERGTPARLLRAALLACAALLASTAAAALARPVDGGVTHVLIEGELDVGHQSLLRRAIDGASARGDALVLELDTPGGSIEIMWQLARQIDEASESGVLPVAWVNDHALSAGALLAFACEHVYMREQATIGAATPIVIGPGGAQPVSEDADVLEKMKSAFRADFRAWAAAHGRSDLLAEAMVDRDVEVILARVDGVEQLMSAQDWDDAMARGDELVQVRTVSPRGELLSLTGPEALELGVADGLAEDLDAVLGKLGLRGTGPTSVERQRSEELAGWLHGVSYVLLSLALTFGLIEMKAPGFGLPGYAALVCLALFLFGRYLTGLADVPQIVLVVVGVVLIAVELLFVPGTLWFGAMGALLAVSGLVWANAGAGFSLGSPVGRELLLDGALGTLLSIVVALALLGLLSRWLPDAPVLGKLVTVPTDDTDHRAAAMPEAEGRHAEAARVGATGRALTALRPVGMVSLDGERELEYEARADGGALDAGARVRVVQVRAGRLLVEAADDAVEEA
jgi:membrane-bound serine protease (ClpP class)